MICCVSIVNEKRRGNEYKLARSDRSTISGISMMNQLKMMTKNHLFVMIMLYEMKVFDVYY